MIERYKTVKIKPTYFFLVIMIAGTMLSCDHSSSGNTNKEEAVSLFQPYPDSVLAVKMVSLFKDWKGNSLIAARADISNMKFVFELDLSKVNANLANLSNKDNFTNSDLYIEMLVNGVSFKNELLEIKENRKSGTLYSDLNDSTGVFLLKYSNTQNYPVRITVPLFVFRRLPANKIYEIKVHVWQNYFLCDRQHPTNNDRPKYYPDTLNMKLIDNIYSISFKMPDVLRSDIICDSIVLQNDEKWSPSGSDHTLFKSSYPDIFYSLEDYSGFQQNTSHIEKSTDKFDKGDTLTLFRYKKHEPFYFNVYDYDNLSNNDLLGDTVFDPESLKTNTTLKLKFGHVARCYVKLKNYGKIN